MDAGEPATCSEQLPTTGSADRLVKSNILYIDGRNLLRSRILEYCQTGSGRGASEDPQRSSVSVVSGHVREILVFLCRYDSRYYGRKFRVLVEDYRDQLKAYLVSRM